MMLLDSIESIEVIIPNFNRYEKLIRAVGSVLDQVGLEVSKISIYDDGSGEELNEQIEKYFKKERRVHLIRMSHTGNPGILRKLGVSRSTAKYVAFLDSDDWWNPKKLITQIEHMRNSGCIASSTNGYHWEVNGPRYFFEPGRSIPARLEFKDLIAENFVINSSMLVEREFLLKIGDYASSAYVKSVEDYATWLRISTFGGIGYINEPLIHYSDTDKKSSIRSSYLFDPRYRAIEDFIEWCESDSSRDQRFVELAIRELTKVKENS